jgi:signal transduction histidine kinase/ligand-binding sensor domain-containing protein
MGRVLFLLLLSLFWLPAFAQEYHYSLRNYKAVDGLPQSQVTALVEDKNGYLWLGTEGGGLARFDGRNFKVYTTIDGMQSNFIRYLMLDSHDNLWIVHPRGISRFNGVEFRKFEQPGGRTSNPAMRRIYEFQDSLFFLSAPGYVGKIYGDSVYYWSNPIAERRQDQQPPLVWYARRVGDAFIFCVDGKSFLVRQGSSSYHIPITEELPKEFSPFEYKDEQWIQAGKKFWRIDIKNKKMARDTLPLQYTVRYYDSVNDLFWTTSGTSLYKEKIVGRTPSVELVTNDLDLDVSTIMVDSDRATWLGTNGKGLFKYYVQDFERANFAGIEHILAIHATSDGAIWLGSANSGLHRIKDGKAKHYSFPPGTGREYVMDIEESPDGKLLVAGSPGLGTYNPKSDSFTWTHYSHEQRKPEIMNIQFDDANEMWLSTAGGGLVHFQGDEIVSYTTKDGLNSNVIMANTYSKWHKSIFISDDFGVYRVKDGKLKLLEIPEIEPTSVININPYRDSLLLLSTTGSGLVVVNPDTGQRKIITTQQGLGSDFIYFAAADKQGNIWVGSEKGISRITLDANNNVASQLHYDYDNGLTGVETNQNAFFLRDSLRLFGLIDGMYQFNDYPAANDERFKTHLTGIEVFYGEIPMKGFSSGASGFFHIPENLSLPHDKNHITFRFNKVNKRYPKAMKFRYILEEFDRAWSKPSLVTEATYGNLPAGDFVFKVMSSDIDGNWNDEVLTYRFSVQAPFYARTGFIVGGVLLSAVLLSGILYWRFKSRVRQMLMLERVRLAEQDKVRKDIARDFHDEMGNQLTRIIHYVSLLKLNGSATVNSDLPALYTKVEDSAKYLYTGTRDFIWSIDPSNDELCKLFLHIRDFGEKLFDEKNISFRATKTIKDVVKLPYGFSREANLIFKEAMTNAFKYSQAKNVNLSLINGHQIRLVLEDDGIGFDKRNCTGDSCRGLKNMEERALKINARLEIRSNGGKGTQIILEFTTQKNKRYGLTV